MSKQPSLMNHSFSEIQVTQIEALPDHLTLHSTLPPPPANTYIHIHIQSDVSVHTYPSLRTSNQEAWLFRPLTGLCVLLIFFFKHLAIFSDTCWASIAGFQMSPHKHTHQALFRVLFQSDMAGCNWAAISRCPAETGPEWASWFSLKEMALCRRVVENTHTHTNTCGKLPIELTTYTHPLSRGCSYIYLGQS